jgi:hypothetical protein
MQIPAVVRTLQMCPTISRIFVGPVDVLQDFLYATSMFACMQVNASSNQHYKSKIEASELF